MSALGSLAVPPPEPALDRTAVEVARLRRQARDELVATRPSVTVHMLADGRSLNPNAARQWLHRRRTAGDLVTVRRQDGTVLVPTFQLDQDLEPRLPVATRVARMVDSGMDGWAVWRWWTTPNGWLDATPEEVLAEGDLDRLDSAVDRLLDPQA